MTTIKKAPLMAFVLGLGLLLTTVTMSSFKNKVVDPYYPNVSGVYQSTALILSQENQANGWRCSGSANTCSAQFATPPSVTNQTPTGTIRSGNYVDY